MRKIILALVLCCTSLSAQYKNIKVNKENNGPNEVSIAINPANPQNIVAASNINNYYYSTDGGSSWSFGYVKSDDYGVWGDPCIIFDLKGNSYYIHLARPSREDWLDRIVCQKSTDWGATWNNPGTYAGLNPRHVQDKAWAGCDWTDSKWKNSIYLSWTQFDKYNSKNPLDSSHIMFSISADGGMTWSEAKRLDQIGGDCRDSSNTVEGAVPCVGPNGEVYDAWAGPLGIVFDRSSDGGVKWQGNINVTPLIWGWDYDIEGIYRCNGMPVIGCDISRSPYRGNIYINWSDGRNGANDIDIFLIKSTDGGTTWSQVKRVNDDELKTGKQQFMSWMGVDPVTGAINILFYDRRNYSDLNTDVYLARSTDGGETFKNIKISETSFIPKKGIFFGDYINVSAYNDFVASFWMRLDESLLSVQYCGIDFKK
jgi:hypothetical protein